MSHQLMSYNIVNVQCTYSGKIMPRYDVATSFKKNSTQLPMALVYKFYNL